ncbi:efflux RND transporter permease subunit, partial [Salmonella sp. SAL4449]|uniref:efflux RND transporter permease subunit n=1 Tax=Salmonella sp. SAL4449 TaxID=3159904 RepID=UPI0039780F8F
LVVDDAIVVVENIHRHIEEGKPPFEAALEGAREIAVPVVSMTITLAAVYAPIGFLTGLTGALFKEFAFTLAGAVIGWASAIFGIGGGSLTVPFLSWRSVPMQQAVA